MTSKPTLALTLAALSLAVSTPSWAAPKKQRASVRTAAVLGFAGAADERAVVEDEVRKQLAGLGWALQKPEKTAGTLKDVQSLGLTCEHGSVECLVRVGALGGAQLVLAGAVNSKDEGVNLELVAVDVATAKEQGRVTLPVAAVSMVDDVEEVLTALLRPDAWRGTVLITVPQRGASIFIDGLPRGFTPLSTPVELAPGPHAVFIGLEGFRAHKQEVVIGYLEQSEVKVSLVPGVSEDPPAYVAVTPPTSVVAPPPATTTVTEAAPKPQKRKALRIAFYDLDLVGVPERTGRVMGSYLVAELRKRERVSVLDGEEIRVLIGDATQGDNARDKSIERCSDEACFAEVAEALGAESVVVAQLTEIGGEILFGLRRIDQNKQEVVATFLERVPATDAKALLPLIGKAIAATFPDLAVRPGQTLGVDARAAQVLDPPPLPPLLSGALYGLAATSAGVGVVMLGVAGFGYLDYEGTRQTLESTRASKDENQALRTREDVFYGSQLGGYVSLGAAVVFGAAAVSTGFFTDWDNAAADARGAP